MLRGTTRDTTRTTKYYETIELLKVVLRGTTSHYEFLRVVLGGNTSCTANHYVVLREEGTLCAFLETFSQRSSFEKIVKKNFIKFMEKQL